MRHCERGGAGRRELSRGTACGEPARYFLWRFEVVVRDTPRSQVAHAIRNQTGKHRSALHFMGGSAGSCVTRHQMVQRTGSRFLALGGVLERASRTCRVRLKAHTSPACPYRLWSHQAEMVYSHSRMLKNSASGVLASYRPSTYYKGMLRAFTRCGLARGKARPGANRLSWQTQGGWVK